MALKILAEQVHHANVDLNHNQINNARIQNLSTEPSSDNAAGRIFYDTDTNQLKVYNGSAFEQLVTETTDTNNITAVESILNASLVVGRDAHNQIIFSTDNEIHFKTNNETPVIKMKASGEIEATSLDISGGVDVDGTLEADAITVNGTALNTVIAGVTVTNATNSAHVLVTDNESPDEENQITFIEGAGGGGANRGLEADGDLTYNPSTGTVSATIFKGNIDAVDGDFDGTLEADAITVGGTALNTVIAGVTVTNATTAAVATTVTITDNESTDENNPLVFVAGGDLDGGNLGLESDGTTHYNPSTGTITATVFKGNIDAVDGDFDGTMEADAITIAGTNLLTGAVTFSGNTVFSGTPEITGTLAVAGDIIHKGDVNNKIAFGTDTQAFETGGATRINISDSGLQIGSSGARVTTIQDSDSLGTSDTKLATQGNIKAYVDARTGTNITSLGAISQETIEFNSGTASSPAVLIKNTANDNAGAVIEIRKDKGAAGADGDEVGIIKFTGDDAAQAITTFATIQTKIGEADNTDEAGILGINIATSNGTTTNARAGAVFTGHKTSDIVDVALGYGSASTVTVNGNLTVTGTTTTVNSTTVNLNDHNIVLDSGNSTSAVVDGAGITIEGGSGSDATFTYSTTGPQFEMKLGSSYEDLQVAKLTASSLDISGDIDIDGTTNLDAVDIDGVVNFAAVDHIMQNDANINDPSDNLLIGFATNAVTLGSPTIFDSTLTIASDIIHKDDTNNKIGFTTDTQTFTTGGSTRMDITDSGIQMGGSGARVTTILDEDNLATDSATALATQQSIKAYIDATGSGTMSGWVLEDGDGTEVNVTDAKEVKFVEGGNIDINWSDTSTGSDGDPYDLTFTVPDAADDTKGAVELATTAEALAGTDTSRAVTAAGLAARSFAASIGDGSATGIAVDHNLNTRDVVVQLYDVSSYDTVIADVVRTTVDRVTITFASAPASNDIRVLVTKID